MTSRISEAEYLELDNDVDKLPTVSNEVAEEKLSAWAQYAENTDFTCAVYREIQTGLRKGKQEKCFSFNPVDYTASEIEDRCLAEYGGGQYWVKGYEKNRLRINENFCVAEPKQTKSVTDEIRELIPHLSSQHSSTDNMPLIQMMLQLQSDAAARQSESMQAMQAQNMQMLTVLLPLLAQKPDPVNPMDMLVQLKNLDSGRDPLEMMMKGIELMKEVGPNDGPTGDSIIDLLAPLVKSFGPALGKLAEQSASNPPQPKANPIPRDHLALIPETKPDKNDALTRLKTNLGYVLRMAQREIPPDHAASTIIGLVEDTQFEQLSEFLDDDQWFAKLKLVNPDIANYEEWFVELRGYLLYDDEELTDDGEGCINAPIDENSETVSEPEQQTITINQDS